MNSPLTMFEKIWRSHTIVERDDGNTLLHVDRHLIHEGSFHAFNRLRERNIPVAQPHQTLGTADHYAPTNSGERKSVSDPEIRRMIDLFKENVDEFKIRAFGLEDTAQGIVHIIGPEQAFTLPGTILVCGDSHTSTHGAIGAFAFGIGTAEVAHVLATQTLWQVRPKTFSIRVEGRLGDGVSAKDLILAIIARIGNAGAIGHVIEYRGSLISGLSVEQRLTICNMSIEAGARAGLIAPDQTTIDYLSGKPLAPKDALLEQAVAYWSTLPTDEGARFDRDMQIDGAAIEPMVTWGTKPETAVSVNARVPDPDAAETHGQAAALRDTLDYMGLTAGMAMTDIHVDQVFIGSCTNGRIEDLRAAAAVARNRRAKVPALVSPGSGFVKAQAEKEGLDRIFIDAGFTWGGASCSMCIGMNGDLVARGKRSASTSNRNFRGRQGPGSRTHLVGPAMAAAAAVSGRIVDVRELGWSEL